MTKFFISKTDTTDLMAVLNHNKLDCMVETLSYLYENQVINDEFLRNLDVTTKTLIFQESQYLNLINIKKAKKKFAPMFLDLQIFKKI